MLLSVFCLCLPLLQVVLAADNVAFPLPFEGLTGRRRSETKTTNQTGRVINEDQSAAEGQFPWQVSLTIRDRARGFFCGGSVLSHEFVLTAAHCIRGKKPKNLKMFFGSLDNKHKGVSRGASALLMHERFAENADGIFNDIGLIRLDSPLPEQWTELLRPIRLPRRAQASLMLDNENTTLSGWSRTSVYGSAPEKLRWITLTVVPLAECADVPDDFWKSFINETHICTKSSGSHSAFLGDSGGPLVWMDPDGVLREVGIVSYGNNIGTLLTRNVFTRVSAFLSWIESHTGLTIEP